MNVMDQEMRYVMNREGDETKSLIKNERHECDCEEGNGIRQDREKA